MIISSGRSYVFVHIPKTGGTSMALALEARAMKDDLMLGDTPKARKRRHKLAGRTSRGRLWKHSTLSDIDGILSPDALSEMFCFTMVRNPWDRVVSYYHWLRDQSFEHPAVTLARALSFLDFVQHDATRASLAANPARHYMSDARGVEHASAYIRLEHLAQDLAPLEAHLGFALHLAQENASARKPDWRPYYDADSAQAVAQACAEDIARFGYSFDS